VAGTQVYTVLWKRQFAYPIYRMTHLDLNRDGLDELIVTTMYGVHIFQVIYNTCYHDQIYINKSFYSLI
jgi:hypothetical protein